MKRAMIASAMLAVSVILSAPANAQKKAPSTADIVVATVNGKPIMNSDVQAFYNRLPAQYQQIPLEQLQSQLIERLIDQLVVADAARKAGFLKRPDVKRKIASVTESVLNETYMSERINSVVTDARVRDEYNKSIALEPKKDEVRARHILVKTKADAMAVISELKGGADFATLAKSKSTGPSGRSGGDLGYFQFKQMVPPFSEAAFSLKPGEITIEPVKTQFGWHVIKVEDRRVSGSSSYEEASGKIRQELTDKIYQETIGGLRAKAKVEITTGGGGSKIKPLR
jgi:peptidyl-prolyl cis-trans isomerase C